PVVTAVVVRACAQPISGVAVRSIGGHRTKWEKHSVPTSITKHARTRDGRYFASADARDSRQIPIEPVARFGILHMVCRLPTAIDFLPACAGHVPHSPSVVFPVN